MSKIFAERAVTGSGEGFFPIRISGDGKSVSYAKKADDGGRIAFPIPKTHPIPETAADWPRRLYGTLD